MHQYMGFHLPLETGLTGYSGSSCCRSGQCLVEIHHSQISTVTYMYMYVFHIQLWHGTNKLDYYLRQNCETELTYIVVHTLANLVSNAIRSSATCWNTVVFPWGLSRESTVTKRVFNAGRACGCYTCDEMYVYIVIIVQNLPFPIRKALIPRTLTFADILLSR